MGIQESKPCLNAIDLEDHAVTAIWRWQIDLQTVRQLRAFGPSAAQDFQLIDCDSAALELGSPVLSDTAGGR